MSCPSCPNGLPLSRSRCQVFAKLWATYVINALHLLAAASQRAKTAEPKSERSVRKHCSSAHSSGDFKLAGPSALPFIDDGTRQSHTYGDAQEYISRGLKRYGPPQRECGLNFMLHKPATASLVLSLIDLLLSPSSPCLPTH
eukprot:6470222-Amphidinium_carterae.2